MTKEEFIKWIETTEETYKYMLLSRMQTDCEYFLGYGYRSEKRLWAQTVDKHIEFMLIIYDCLIVKPEWLTLADIQKYESAMKNG